MAQFRKGQSGNPGGRPKEDNEVKALAKQYTKQAVKRLVSWMNSDNAKASVSASIALLDRGWGRPTQGLTIAEEMRPLVIDKVTDQDIAHRRADVADE